MIGLAELLVYIILAAGTLVLAINSFRLPKRGKRDQRPDRNSNMIQCDVTPSVSSNNGHHQQQQQHCDVVDSAVSSFALPTTAARRSNAGQQQQQSAAPSSALTSVSSDHQEKQIVEKLKLDNSQLTMENQRMETECFQLRLELQFSRTETEQLQQKNEDLVNLLRITQRQMQNSTNSTSAEIKTKSADVVPDLILAESCYPVECSSQMSNLQTSAQLQKSSNSTSSSAFELEATTSTAQRIVMTTNPSTVYDSLDIVDALQGVNSRTSKFRLSTFKIVFVGDSGVGKTSFIRRLCTDDDFMPTFSATVGVDYLMKTITVNRRKIMLQIWDTAGQERYRSLTRQYFRKADGVVVMYDVTNESSFRNLRSWLESIQEGVVDDTVIAIVANKQDTIEGATVRVVTETDGINLAKDYDAVFGETSAKSGFGVLSVIEAMTSILLVREMSLVDLIKTDAIECQNTSPVKRSRSSCFGRRFLRSNSRKK